AVLAIAGFPFLSGSYSKAMILTHAGAFGSYAQHLGKSPFYWAFFVLPSVIAYVTAFYMTRCWMLTFWGKPRNQHLYDHAHESPVLYVPLIVLAIASIIGGNFLRVRDLIEASQREATTLVKSMNGAAPAAQRRPEFAQANYTLFQY